MQIRQDGNQARVPLEDIAVLLIDHAQVSLTAQLLSACADRQIAVITVGQTHHPNGVLLPFHPHSRALKVMQAQLSLTQSRRKRLWQGIVRAKIANQSVVLSRRGAVDASRDLQKMVAHVQPGDVGNMEGKAAQKYFRSLFESRFTRQQARFYNGVLDYGYAVVRAAIARSLVAYGFLPAFGLFHHNEQNAFNLADDLIEAYRPLVDWHVITHFPSEPESAISPADKAVMVSLLHQDIRLSSHESGGRCTLLAAVETTVQTLSSIVVRETGSLAMPVLGE
jgi:CRISPR-associated protein Cas1